MDVVNLFKNEFLFSTVEYGTCSLAELDILTSSRISNYHLHLSFEPVFKGTTLWVNFRGKQQNLKK